MSEAAKNQSSISPTGEKSTPLYQEHVRLSAHIAGFGGWQMPIYYSGIIDEHRHTRTRAGIFDICHMGEFMVHGADAAADLEHLLPLKISSMPVGKCKYSFFLNPDGGVRDDLLVYRMDVARFMLVVNAVPVESDVAWIVQHLSKNTCFEDISEKTAKLDIQGPLSGQVMEEVFGISLKNLSYYSFTTQRVFGIDMIISRTGYTGELGYEVFFDSIYAVDIWNRFLSHPLVKPVGLGARDTLRLEMGYPLYGHDLSTAYSPLQAGFSRFVSMEKDFIGKQALAEQIAKKDYPMLTGFQIAGRRCAREGYRIMKNERKIGVVTSASFSPSLGYCIGLAYVAESFVGKGEKIQVQSDKTSFDAEITDIPFYKKGTVRQ